MQNVLTCAQMRAADKYTIETLGVPSAQLMERAGAAIAEETETLLREIGGRSVLAVCGGGNNGGDGWCAARLLAERGFETAVYTLTEKLSADCAAQRAAYENSVRLAGKTPAVVASFPDKKYDVIIDAVFGTGFRGVPEGRFAEAIACMNRSGAKIVSADIPSGLNGDSGAFAQCVKADITVTIGEWKGGLLLGDGPDVCGKVIRRDIGIELPAPAQAGLCSAADFAGVFPPRRANTNKGSFGKAVILAGSAAYSGAPLLSAAAALKCGCGYTRLAVPPTSFRSISAGFPMRSSPPPPPKTDACALTRSLCKRFRAARTLSPSAWGAAFRAGCMKALRIFSPNFAARSSSTPMRSILSRSTARISCAKNPAARSLRPIRRSFPACARNRSKRCCETERRSPRSLPPNTA